LSTSVLQAPAVCSFSSLERNAIAANLPAKRKSFQLKPCRKTVSPVEGASLARTLLAIVAMVVWLAIAYLALSVVFSIFIGKFIIAGKGRK
jgi:hypothetical protein